MEFAPPARSSTQRQSSSFNFSPAADQTHVSVKIMMIHEAAETVLNETAMIVPWPPVCLRQ
jgi:hypothetical protein